MANDMRFRPFVTESIQYTHKEGSEFDQSHYTGSVLSIINRANTYNRPDVLRSVQNFLKKIGSDIKIKQMSTESALSYIENNRKLEIDYDYYKDPAHKDIKSPMPPNGLVPIHGRSKQLFLNSESGHAMTGLIHFRENGACKIFLAPLEPSVGSIRDPDRIYAVKKPKSGVNYGIYTKRSINFQPFIHRKKDLNGISGPTAHKQLIAQIQKKEKYANDGFDSGKYIGFSVIKGRVSDGTINQYTFESGTVNIKSSGSDTAPEAWQAAIHQTFDNLSLTEFDSKIADKI